MPFRKSSSLRRLSAQRSHQLVVTASGRQRTGALQTRPEIEKPLLVVTTRQLDASFARTTLDSGYRSIKRAECKKEIGCGHTGLMKQRCATFSEPSSAAVSG